MVSGPEKKPEVSLRPSLGGSDLPIEILFVTSSSRDFGQVADMLRGRVWHLSWVSAIEGAQTLLKQRAFPLVICDYELQDGSWRDIRDTISHLEHPPIVIVSCAGDDRRRWAEAFNLGAYDVLAKPFDHSELVHVLNMAWHASRRKLPQSAHAMAPVAALG